VYTSFWDTLYFTDTHTVLNVTGLHGYDKSFVSEEGDILWCAVFDKLGCPVGEKMLLNTAAKELQHQPVFPLMHSFVHKYKCTFDNSLFTAITYI
jgi:hypothetical protein